MEACVVICRTAKPQERHNKILFINAVTEVTRERAQSFLTDEHIANIVNTYRGFTEIDGFSRVVSNDEIRQQGNNLSIPLYCRRDVLSQNHIAKSSAQYGKEPFDEVIAAWQKSSQELRQSMRELFEVIEKT
jgi:type I restriction enzyme M protein